jgi:hypothetical protein
LTAIDRKYGIEVESVAIGRAGRPRLKGDRGMSTIRRIIVVVALIFTFGGAGPAFAGEFNVTTSGTYVPVHPSENQIAALKDEGPTIVRVSAGDGFSWGDAGIGAGVGVAMAVIVLGGGLALSQRRPQRISQV